MVDSIIRLAETQSYSKGLCSTALAPSHTFIANSTVFNAVPPLLL